ncbi:LysR family transcriptional regulator [bacterium]|nr:LysR family transcriptional regulator [bacterium]
MRGPSLEELDSIIALARRRNFRAAARDLGVSPTVLSQRIAASEAKLDVRLFNRTTRSVAATAAGERFLAEIEPALAALSHAFETLDETRASPRGWLRINSSVGAALRLMPSLFLPFCAAFPEIELDLVTEDRLIDIVAEGFDAGIRTMGGVPRDMIALRLEPDQTSSVVGTPDYWARMPPPRTPRDLMTHTCIRARLPGGDLSPWEFLEGGKLLRLDVPGKLILDHAGLMLQAALSGAGVAQLPDWWTEADRAEGRLVGHLRDVIPVHGGLALYYPSRRHPSAAFQAMVDFIGGAYRRPAAERGQDQSTAGPQANAGKI